MVDSLSISTLILSLVLAVFCASTAAGQRSRGLLALFFFFLAVQSGFKYLGFASSLFVNLPFQLILPALTGTLIPVVIYLFVREILGLPVTRGFYWRAAILPVATVVVFTTFFLLTRGFTVEAFHVFEGIVGMAALTALSYILYIILSFRDIRGSTARSPELPTQSRLVVYWIRWLLGLMLFRASLAIVFLFLQVTSKDEPWFETVLLAQRYVVAVTLLLATALTAYYALRNPALFDRMAEQDSLEQQLAMVILPASEKKAIRREPATDEIQEWVERIRGAVERDRLYLDPGLSPKRLADLTGIPAYRITQSLNRGMGQNFNEFIHGYRIDHACRLLADPANRRETIYAIALNSGFSSEAPFYAAFRKRTGTSPSAFRSAALGQGAAG